MVAEENNWKAIFSFSPEGLPKIPQSLFVATSKDGLEWDFTGVPISPLDLSYLDPTGILLSNGDYLVVSAVAKNALKKAKRLPCGCYFCFITLLAVAQSTKGSLTIILIFSWFSFKNEQKFI